MQSFCGVAPRAWPPPGAQPPRASVLSTGATPLQCVFCLTSLVISLLPLFPPHRRSRRPAPPGSLVHSPPGRQEWPACPALLGECSVRLRQFPWPVCNWNHSPALQEHAVLCDWRLAGTGGGLRCLILGGGGVNTAVRAFAWGGAPPLPAPLRRQDCGLRPGTHVPPTCEPSIASPTQHPPALYWLRVRPAQSVLASSILTPAFLASQE